MKELNEEMKTMQKLFLDLHLFLDLQLFIAQKCYLIP